MNHDNVTLVGVWTKWIHFVKFGEQGLESVQYNSASLWFYLHQKTAASWDLDIALGHIAISIPFW